MGTGKRDSTDNNIHGLEDFGLRSIKALAALGARKVTVGFYWTPPTAKTLLKLHPRERRRAATARYWDGIDAIMKLAPEAKLKPGMKLRLSAESLARLPRVKAIGPFVVESIYGMKKQKVRSPQNPRGFAVHVRLIKETAGQRHGMQFVNEKTLILKAKDESAARSKVERHFLGATWMRPYVEPTGQVVRWRLEKILEVQGVAFDPLEDGVTHAWSTGGRRRMRPGSGWNP